MKHTASILVLAAIGGFAFGCATPRVPDSLFVCGGCPTAQESADRELAATTTEYSWARSWVEQHCLTSSVSGSQRVFVLRESRPRIASILEHRAGLTLGDVLHQTGVAAGEVRVLRQIGPGKDLRFQAADLTSEIQPLDVVSFGGMLK
jgi:hypothetical protein